MYIEKYWGNSIGGTDDSLTLLDYLLDKRKNEISLSEIFADTGLSKLNWDFRKTKPELEYESQDGGRHEFYYAIDLVTDLAALMLECHVNGSVSLGELMNDEASHIISIISTQEERNSMCKALADYYADPLVYDLHEMVPDDEMIELARDCENIREELFQ